ncbi:MAG: flavin reductase family protein [Candidatus Bathyarchaeia archaeon]
MSGKIDVLPYAYLDRTVNMLSQCGLLLVSGEMEKANVMTIGWGFLGRIWEKPFFIVAVRPTRYTFRFIEEVGDFTVNVPKKGMEEIVNYCGTVSGKQHDKFKEKGLTPMPSKYVRSPIISECNMHYECKVVYKTNLMPPYLPKNIIEIHYPNRDFHTLYFGEIVATYADKNMK